MVGMQACQKDAMAKDVHGGQDARVSPILGPGSSNVAKRLDAHVSNPVARRTMPKRQIPHARIGSQVIVSLELTTPVGWWLEDDVWDSVAAQVKGAAQGLVQSRVGRGKDVAPCESKAAEMRKDSKSTQPPSLVGAKLGVAVAVEGRAELDGILGRQVGRTPLGI
mmetsp:Transcript_46808/g.101678  ORF Transcript_46808/g.101678 Transcript_46808/m.101678 type:complete len:165 (+) Transcript_46808:279-773(+)